MSIERFEELAADYLDGGLDQAGEQELAALIHDDAALRRKFLHQAELDGLLRVHHLSEGELEETIQRTLISLPERPSASAARQTAEQVMARVARTPAPVALPRRRWEFLAIVAGVLLIVSAAVYKVFFAEDPVRLTSLVGVATVEKVSGQAFVLFTALEEKRQASVGLPLQVSHGLEVNAGALALKYWDGTRLELHALATGRLWLSDRKRMRAEGLNVRPGAGKRLLLESGVVTADVVKQKADEPFAIVTPHAEIEVVGTRFTVMVLAGSTRVEVAEGRVKVTRLSDQTSVAVEAGQSVTVTPAAQMSVERAQL